MTFHHKYASLLLLALCITAALIFRRFVFVAWYPVMMSVAVATGFAISLFREKSLCEEMAERIPPHILPPGSRPYCRKYTVFWAAWLTANGVIAAFTVYADLKIWILWNCCLSYCATALIVLCEMFIRRRRFSVVFHTSGSTSAPKRIVKTFASLAKETAMHCRRLGEAGTFNGAPTFIATVEPNHMYGKLWLDMLPKAAGCKAIGGIFTPEALIEAMAANEKTILITTPSFISRFAEYADQYTIPQNCVEIVTSGALLTAKTAAEAKRIFGRAPLEIFGSTETGGVAWRRQDGEPPSDGFDWNVFAPVRISSADDGRLVVRSPFSFRYTYIMGDAVEMSPDRRRFRLLGRKDRLVKISEQRVSLPEMEEKMRTLPEIDDIALAALEGKHGAYLGAVVKLCSQNSGKKESAKALRGKLAGIFPPGAVPRVFRFVAELPRNHQGKVLTAEIKRILASEYIEPAVADIERSDIRYSATFSFDPNAPYFKGHFEGFPVLAGVVQLGTAMTFAERLVGEKLHLKAVKKMKFSGIVKPGDQIRFTLENKNNGEFPYSYEKAGSICASGVLVTDFNQTEEEEP